MKYLGLIATLLVSTSAFAGSMDILLCPTAASTFSIPGEDCFTDETAQYTSTPGGTVDIDIWARARGDSSPFWSVFVPCGPDGFFEKGAACAMDLFISNNGAVALAWTTPDPDCTISHDTASDGDDIFSFECPVSTQNLGDCQNFDWSDDTLIKVQNQYVKIATVTYGALAGSPFGTRLTSDGRPDVFRPDWQTGLCTNEDPTPFLQDPINQPRIIACDDTGDGGDGRCDVNDKCVNVAQVDDQADRNNNFVPDECECGDAYEGTGPGDSNYGTITSIDISAASLCANGVFACNEEKSDCDGDGSVTAIDVGCITNIVNNSTPQNPIFGECPARCGLPNVNPSCNNP